MSAPPRTERRIADHTCDDGDIVRLYEAEQEDGKRWWIVRACWPNGFLRAVRWCYTPTETRIIYMEASGGEVLPGERRGEASAFEEVA